MFKTKWQKKYEKAMKTIEFWKQFYDNEVKMLPDDSHLREIRTAQKITLDDTLRYMKRIAES